MERLADALDKRGQQIAGLVSNENGMPISLSSLIEGVAPANVLRYYAALARTTPVEESRPAVGRAGDTLVRREPVGVVAAIVPWNAPSLLTSFNSRRR